jgi:hypothetical protein
LRNEGVLGTFISLRPEFVVTRINWSNFEGRRAEQKKVDRHYVFYNVGHGEG